MKWWVPPSTARWSVTRRGVRTIYRKETSRLTSRFMTSLWIWQALSNINGTTVSFHLYVQNILFKMSLVAFSTYGPDSLLLHFMFILPNSRHMNHQYAWLNEWRFTSYLQYFSHGTAATIYKKWFVITFERFFGGYHQPILLLNWQERTYAWCGYSWHGAPFNVLSDGCKILHNYTSDASIWRTSTCI